MAKKTTKQPKGKTYIPRQSRKFQLRLNHPIDAHVGKILDYAKSQRREVTMIRDGVRLLWALQNDDLNVLFELFPHMQRQFKPDAEELIEQFRQMLMQYSSAPVQPVSQPLSMGQSGPKPLNAPQFALPLPDDDEEDGDDTLLVNRSSDSNANSVMAGLFEVIK